MNRLEERVVTEVNALHIGSPKTLTERLRILEHQGVLTRTVYAEVPSNISEELLAKAAKAKAEAAKK